MHLHEEIFEAIRSAARDVDGRVLEATVVLAVELAREDREGRKVGTIFVVGDSEEEMRRSRPLIPEARVDAQEIRWVPPSETKRSEVLSGSA